jgi:hypothetical protein
MGSTARRIGVEHGRRVGECAGGNSSGRSKGGTPGKELGRHGGSMVMGEERLRRGSMGRRRHNGVAVRWFSVSLDSDKNWKEDKERDGNVGETHTRHVACVRGGGRQRCDRPSVCQRFPFYNHA